jgi:perosamine synthetase
MKIPVSSPSLTEKDYEYVNDAIRSGWISGSKGDYIDKFESQFSKYCNVKYGVACSSGTAALQLAISVLELTKNDEVIVPTFTNIATLLPIISVGAKPILVDSDPEIWGMDCNQIEKKITKNTRAIIPVHIYGHPVDMDIIMELSQKYNLTVIEDAAEAHGSNYKGKKIGGIGHMGCFSFYANKIITTGEGGMIVTDNEKFAEKTKMLCNLAFSDTVRYKHDFFGYNFRMSNILAALGCSQLSRIEELIRHKQFVGKIYNSLLTEVPGIQTPTEKSWATNVYWMYGIVLDDSFPMTRDELRDFLSSHGIETRTFFLPMHKQPVFINNGFFIDEDYSVSERLSKNGLYLPSGFTITEKEINYVVKNIKKASKTAKKGLNTNTSNN